MHPARVAACLGPVVVLATSFALAQTEPAPSGEPGEPVTPPAIEATQVAEGIWMLRSNSQTANPTTVLSIGEDGVFIADPNLLAVSDDLRKKIAELGGGEIRYITSSHHHGDHTEGYESFTGDGVGVVPTIQRERMASQNVVGRSRPMGEASLPAMTFEDSTTLTLNGQTIELLTLPDKNGHTDGDALVYFSDAGVLYVGDYLFLDRFPSIDTAAGGSLEGYIANVEWILETYPEETIVIPGHGTFAPEEVRPVTMEHFARNLDQLKRSISYIRSAIDAGVPLAKLRGAGLPPEMAGYAQRPRYVSAADWIDIVADTQKKKGVPTTAK